MKPRFYKTNLFRIISFGWISAITLAPIGIFINKDEFDVWYVRNEEAIHWYQQQELWYIGFYLWYFIEWLIKLVTPPIGAYKDLGFEREAKTFRFDMLYTLRRKKFAWFYYIKG